MNVTVKLFATLRAGRFESEDRTFPEGTRVEQAIAGLGLREGEATVVFVNSRHASGADSLSEGDVLALFPPVGGG
jgi:sulfur-carrier protein